MPAHRLLIAAVPVAAPTARQKSEGKQNHVGPRLGQRRSAARDRGDGAQLASSNTTKTDGTVGNTTVTPTAALTAAVVKTVAPAAPAKLGTTGD